MQAVHFLQFRRLCITVKPAGRPWGSQTIMAICEFHLNFHSPCNALEQVNSMITVGIYTYQEIVKQIKTSNENRIDHSPKILLK